MDAAGPYTLHLRDSGEARTHDKRIKSPLLYQLSYGIKKPPPAWWNAEGGLVAPSLCRDRGAVSSRSGRQHLIDGSDRVTYRQTR